jgi:Na+-translocating ferredoxin:NAD+ oxidoreductase subunit B
MPSPDQETTMANDIYLELQKRLDLYSLGFPATSSGIEIQMLKKLFSEDDAAFFLQMSPRLEDAASVAARIGKPVDVITERLEDMTRRGLLFRLVKDGTAKYGAIPFMHGLVEFQVGRFDRDMSAMLERYFEEGFHDAIARNASLFLRTIPVERSVVPEHRVAAFEDAREILDRADIIAVSNCICRTEKKMMDGGCGKPVETCFMFGSMARYYIENKLGRQVDAAEALKIVREAQDAGLVTQPSTSQNPAGMCNCCGDCCGVLMAVKKFPKPAEMVFSNYQAVADRDLCNGCEACLDRCQMEAITMNDRSEAVVNRDRCIGCGLCIASCPAGALSLMPKPEIERQVPPATTTEQMLAMAKRRGIL